MRWGGEIGWGGDLVEKARENFTTKTRERAETRDVWDLYDVREDEGYTGFGSLVARARKIVKQEHEQDER